VARTQAGPAVTACWMIGGTGCCLSAMSYMELSARIPVTGSVYAFAYHALGEVFAVVGAACITLEYGISASAVAANWSEKFINLLEAFGANTFASYMSATLGPVTLSIPALLVLLVVTVTLAAGGSLGKVFTRGSSMLAVILILSMSALALSQFDGSNLQPFVPSELPPSADQSVAFQGGAAGVFSGSVTTFFGFLGYDEVCCLAGEAENPRRSVPLAVVGTLVTATLLPVLGSVALCGMVPYYEIDKSAGFEVAFRQQGWPVLAHCVAFGELIVLFIVTYMCTLAQPRVFYALAKDGLLPQRFLDTDSSGSPRFATYATGLLLMICGALLPFDLLSNAISGGVLLAFTLVNCCCIMIRYESGDGNVGVSSLGRRNFLGPSLGCFSFFSTVSAFCFQHANYRATPSEATAYHIGGGVAAVMAVAGLCGVLMHSRRIEEEDEGEAYFKVPCVPWVPFLAIIFNSVMLASMNLRDFGLLMLYLVVVLVPYLIFAMCRRSALTDSESRVSLTIT